LHDLAVQSADKIEEMEDAKYEATLRISSGIESGKLTLISWGCSKLNSLIQKMEAERPLWIEEQINDRKSNYAEGRQTILQNFHSLMEKLRPKSELPEHVGEFKHTMLNKVVPSLNSIGFDSLSAELENYVRKIVKNSEDVAEARRLISNADSWLQNNKGVLRTKLIQEIRSAKEAAKDYSSKLRGMSQRINDNDLLLLRTEISNFSKELTTAEDKLSKKANAIWKSKITDEDSITTLLEDLDSLIRAYDGLDNDLEDFHIQKRALQLYKQAYGRLNDLSLSWDDFNKLLKELEKEALRSLPDEGYPWLPDETIKALAANVSDNRKHLSKEWTDLVLASEPDIPLMDVSSANQLQNKITRYPSYITDSHLKKLSKLEKVLEKRLSEIKIEWLVEKFKELSEKDRKKFVNKISSSV
jgi:hypothetical protein